MSMSTLSRSPVSPLPPPPSGLPLLLDFLTNLFPPDSFLDKLLHFLLYGLLLALASTAFALIAALVAGLLLGILICISG